MADNKQQEEKSIESMTILKTSSSPSTINNNNVLPVKSILKTSSTTTTSNDDDNLDEDDEEYEYEEYEVDEDEEIDDDNDNNNQIQNLQSTKQSINPKTIINQNEQQQKITTNIEDENEEEYEDEEIEYEEEEEVEIEEDDDEYDNVANKIDELINKTSDLKQESCLNKSEIDKKFITTDNTNQQPKQIQTVSSFTNEFNKSNDDHNVGNKFKDEFDINDDQIAMNLATSSLKHASNKWNISDLNDDDDNDNPVVAFNKVMMMMSFNEYRTKNPIIQQKLKIHNAIQANKKMKQQQQSNNDDYDQEDEEEIGEIEVALEENFIEEEDENVEMEDDDDDDEQKITPEMLSEQNNQQLQRLSLFRPTMFENQRSISPSSLILEQIYQTILDRKIDQLQILLENMPNFFIDSILRSGWTALMYSAYFAFPEFVQFCLKRGADPNYYNGSNKMTPLLAVCLSRNTNETQILHCMQLLLDNGARLEINDHYGHSSSSSSLLLLHNAARLGLNRLIKYLCHNGIDINRIDNHGFTALHYAVIENQKQVIETLLKQKLIKTDIQNNDGMTACQLAKSMNNYEIADILHQANNNKDISKAIPNSQLQRKKFAENFIENIIADAATVVAATATAAIQRNDSISYRTMLVDDNSYNNNNNIGPEIKIDSCPTLLSSQSIDDNENENNNNDNEIVPEFALNTQITDLSKKYSIDLSSSLHPSSAANIHQYAINNNNNDRVNGQWQILFGHLLLTFFVYVLYKTIRQIFF
ncbi:ankyrin repeat, SAM and basic leucine zipper [Dermatophagoides pteronyssinus]|uniref:Alpha-latrotoxin n=1 Tax=Dermatophagoides pteronyssinus TaxID=6956 RepID=A0ABQ8J662_DERPT|nr:ankyrin repeat, SAM and basic leucine zipper [Dermatophagoides pteronyssinus]